MNKVIRRAQLWWVPAILVVFCITWTVAAEGASQDSVLTVHEWGTFTSLQDETGRAISHINADEEELPTFVHNLGDQPKSAERLRCPRLKFACRPPYSPAHRHRFPS